MTQRNRIGSGGAQIGQCRAGGPLGQPLAVRSGNQRVVTVARHWQVEQRLQQILHRHGTFEIAAPDDMGNTGSSIVDDDGDLDVIRVPLDVLGVNYYSTGRVRHFSGCHYRRLAHIQPPRRAVGRIGPPPACPRIDRPRFAVRRTRARRDFGTRAGAGINDAQRAQPVERRCMLVRMIGLDVERVPLDAKPAQIVEDRIYKFRPTARRIDILDPQHEPPAASPVTRPRNVMRQHCRQRVAEVEATGGGRRKAGHNILWVISHIYPLDHEP